MHPSYVSAMRLYERLALILPLVIYAPLAGYGAYVQRESLNPDAIAYIRRALYLADGQAWASISSYWSPLISWCIAPFVAVGWDGLHAARGVQAACGLVYVLLVCRLIRRFDNLDVLVRLTAGCIVAMFAVHFMMQMITPDLLVATCLFAYFLLVTRRNLLESRVAQVMTGVAGAVAYLAKAYALPFVVVHYLVSVSLRARSEHGRYRLSAGRSLGRGASVAGVGLAALAFTAAPWILLLGLKYGRFVVTSAASINHAVIGPGGADDNDEYFGIVRAPFILKHEVPEDAPRAYWSPFDNWESLQHQIRVVVHNAWEILQTASTIDQLWLVPIAVLAWPLVRGSRNQLSDEVSSRITWVAMTILVYCGGLLPVHFEPRFVRPLVFPLGLLLVLNVWQAALQRYLFTSAITTSLVARRLIHFPVLLSFGLLMLVYVTDNIMHPRRPRHRAIAEAIREAGVSGPIASTHKHDGMYLCYHLGMPLAGFPSGNSPEEVQRKLLSGAPAALVVWRPLKTDGKRVYTEASPQDLLVREILRRPGWQRLLTKRRSEYGTIEVWVHRSREADANEWSTGVFRAEAEVTVPERPP